MKVAMPKQDRTIRVLGCDPSKRNWGLAKGLYDLDTHQLVIQELLLTQPVLPTGKQVRVSSQDIECANQLFKEAMAAVEGAHAVFVEVPAGSQSASAMKGYGICVGVLGAMKASKVAFFELTPMEVKLAGAGKKTATKKDMIEWAVDRHPEANWPVYNRGGQAKVSDSKAEHMADAIAAIYAGLASAQFQQILPFLAVNP